MLYVMKSKPYMKNGKMHTSIQPVTPHIAVSSVSDLLENADTYLAVIPKDERVNLYATLSHIDTSKKLSTRSWTHQDVVFFDIDNVDLDKTGEYLKILETTLNVDSNKIASVISGNGLHVMIQLLKPFDSEKYFKHYKKDYIEICRKIDEKIKSAGLSGECDPQVFKPKTMFRVPSTINQKPDREPKEVKLINATCEPYDLDLRHLSGLPYVAEKEQISPDQMSHIKVDTESVEAGCDFLKYVKKMGGNVSEPIWQAALTITSRLKDPLKKSIEYSKKHPGFCPEQTKEKMSRALKSCGPRTCDSIDDLFGGCRKCPNYKKVRSPIMLKNPNFIASDHVGFRIPNARGTLVAQHEDLLRYYKKKVPFKNINEMHYRYEKGYWRNRSKRYIENYAQEHFKPAPKQIERAEFRSLVQCTNLDEMEFFDKPKALGKINCKNGVVDIKTGELLPHCPTYGFRQMLDFDYDDRAECPEFDRLMVNVTSGDSQSANILLEFFGYCLSGENPAKTSKFLVLTGEGANGKSTLLEIFAELLGNSVSATDARFMAGESSHFHMHDMCKALVNICEELPSGGRGAAEQWEAVKRIASGNPVKAAEKGKTGYVIRPKTKLIFTCNELPSGGKANHGWFRKMLIIPFEERFSSEAGNLDVTLASRIKENELPGVLNRCIEGYMRLKAQGYKFSTSTRVEQIQDEFAEDKDSVKAFYMKALEIDPKIMGESSDEDQGESQLSVTDRAKAKVAAWLKAKDEAEGVTREHYFGRPANETVAAKDDPLGDDEPLDLSAVPFMVQDKKGEYYISKSKLWRVYYNYTKDEGGHPMKNLKFYSRLADIIHHDVNEKCGRKNRKRTQTHKKYISFRGRNTMDDEKCVIGTHRVRCGNRIEIVLFGLKVQENISQDIIDTSSDKNYR